MIFRAPNKYVAHVIAVPKVIGPAWTAFVGSILLSLLAIQNGNINRDGMLYVDTARAFMDGGLGAALKVFPWPFLSIAMAWVSQLAGIGLEASGYLLNALFMAGASALLVASSTRFYPEASWYVCLVVLSLPGFNGYRDELLREYGAWFFIMLSFWLAMRWAEMPNWRMALATQAVLVFAALFRPEALAFFLALFLWQVFSSPAEGRWWRVVQIGALPVLCLVLLLALHATGNLGSDRLAADFGRVSLERFDVKAQAMAQAFIPYARDQAPFILFFGSIGIIPLKFVVKMGVFILPLLYSAMSEGVRGIFRRGQVFPWAFLVYLLVLGVFVLDLQFLSGRYLALLLVFSAPWTGLGLWLLARRLPRWVGAMVTLSLLIMLANVVSSQPGKTHFVEAGTWLAKNARDTERVYVESARAAYYAGWRFSARPLPESRDQLAQGLLQGKYDLVVIEVSHREPSIGPWLESVKFKQVVRFEDTKGDAVIVARPITGEGQDKASNNPSMRENTGSME
jgi:hypothetical protein